MKKLATFAAASALALSAGTASAAIIDVTAELSATITGIATGTQTGTGVGTYDTDTQILTLNMEYEVDTTFGPLQVLQDQTSIVIIDFSAAPIGGTNEITSCVDNGTYAGCAAVPVGQVAFGTVAGTWEAFETTGSFAGANTIQNYTISAVPVPAAVWLFGSALLGLTGVTRRRAKAA